MSCRIHGGVDFFLQQPGLIRVKEIFSIVNEQDNIIMKKQSIKFEPTAGGE
jgi:hypothetical protein